MSEHTRRLRTIHLVRYGLPGAMTVAGIVLVIVGGTRHIVVSCIGLAAVCIALLVWLTNVFARMSIVSQNDRDLEARAREHYSRAHGWIDPQTLAAMGPAAPPSRPRSADPSSRRPSPDQTGPAPLDLGPEPEHTATPRPAPPRPSRPYDAPARVRSRGGAGARDRGRRPD